MRLADLPAAVLTALEVLTISDVDEAASGLSLVAEGADYC